MAPRPNTRLIQEFGAVQAQVGDLIKAVDKLAERIDAKVTEQDKRIGRVENLQYKIAGVFLACSFLLTKVDFSQLFAVGSTVWH